MTISRNWIVSGTNFNNMFLIRLLRLARDQDQPSCVSERDRMGIEMDGERHANGSIQMRYGSGLWRIRPQRGNAISCTHETITRRGIRRDRSARFYRRLRYWRSISESRIYPRVGG